MKPDQNATKLCTRLFRSTIDKNIPVNVQVSEVFQKKIYNLIVDVIYIASLILKSLPAHLCSHLCSLVMSLLQTLLGHYIYVCFLNICSAIQRISKISTVSCHKPTLFLVYTRFRSGNSCFQSPNLPAAKIDKYYFSTSLLLQWFFFGNSQSTIT